MSCILSKLHIVLSVSFLAWDKHHRWIQVYQTSSWEETNKSRRWFVYLVFIYLFCFVFNSPMWRVFESTKDLLDKMHLGKGKLADINDSSSFCFSRCSPPFPWMHKWACIQRTLLKKRKQTNKPYIVHSFLPIWSTFLFGGRAGLYFWNSFWESISGFPFQFFLQQPLFTIVTN